MLILSTVLLVLLVACLSRLLPAIVEYRRKCRLASSFPGWPAHWFLGNIPDFIESDKVYYKWIDYIAAERHKVTRTWLGPTTLIMVNLHHPDAIKQVLKTPKSDLIYRAFIPWLGDGLITSKGENWARNRKLLTPAFHFAILEPYVDVYQDCLETLVRKWSDSARNSQPVLLFKTMTVLSLDIILRCAFSYSSGCQETDKKHPYCEAVHELCKLACTRCLNPLYFSDWMYSLSSPGRRSRHLCKLVHNRAEKVIRERRRALKLDDTETPIARKEVFSAVAKQGRYLDFLDILLSAEDEEGNGLTDLEIRDEVDTFMFAGHDTTASGSSWTLYCLARYPEHQEKVRDEVRRVLEGRERLEYKDLKQLQYTQLCIKEAMRLYPPAANIMREADHDIDVCGHTIPKGVHICLYIHTVHRHPDVWENPDEFDPLRFHPDSGSKLDPYAYIPFSAGPRNCIGQNFAIDEMKVVVATIVLKFNLSYTHTDRPSITPCGVARPEEDFQVDVELLE